MFSIGYQKNNDRGKNYYRSQQQQQLRKQSRDNMPRRRESFLLLEQAVTVDSKEIDALVAKIGETLQFQRIPGGGGGAKQQQQLQQQHHNHHQQQQQQYKQHHHYFHYQQQEPRGSARCGMCCIERWKAPSRNKPYSVPSRARDAGSSAAGKSESMRLPPGTTEHEAQQKLEQLLSSGNLIKEAVRRLHADHHYSHIYAEKITL
uniref:glycogen synthase kinase binding protein n=1 Tax=Pristiophorus japonicus TaxID=55135 RepID=UPI00398ED94E